MEAPTLGTAGLSKNGKLVYLSSHPPDFVGDAPPLVLSHTFHMSAIQIHK